MISFKLQAKNEKALDDVLKKPKPPFNISC